jgi:hypothetical protein
MSVLPVDVDTKIRSDFSSVDDQREVSGLLVDLWHQPLNVGPAQLSRALFVLAEGNVSIMRALCNELMGDPRDVIMAAERKAGDPGHYFILHSGPERKDPCHAPPQHRHRTSLVRRVQCA